jgi:sulfatase maturation enzyme AslB (radical SAM superfamily)
MTPKDMLTNKTFCPMPWTGLMYNFDGAVKNCIRSAGAIGDLKHENIQDIVLGSTNVSAQQNIVNNQPVATCHTCYDLEGDKSGFNIISDRIFYIRELKKVPTDTYQSGNFDLQTVDVRWTNLCNFSCVYCGPDFSSKWAAELNEYLDTPSAAQKQQFKNYIFENAHKLKHVYLAGGEPLLMKENEEFLDLLKSNNPGVNLRINTNLSKVDTRVFDKICEFKNVHWTVSVETIEEEFEYVRHGGRWTDFLDNLNIIGKLDHRISFNMLHFLLNYQSVFGCVDFLKNLGFHNNSYIIGALLDPLYLNVRNLPDSVLNSVRDTLQNKINQHPGYLLEDSYRNMLAYLNTPFEKNLKQSFADLAILDQRRGLNSRDIFKELYKLA